MLKPLDATEAEAVWTAELLSGLREDGFRIARPVRGAGGEWIVAGWTAWRRVEGEHALDRWAETIEAGEALHSALVSVARPAFLDERTHAWAVGDRIAWNELLLDPLPDVKHVPRLLAAMRPLDHVPSQVVHGDLLGNVLFAGGLPPVVIDFTPYWRPVGFASAVVVADALVWYGADESILQAVSHVGDFEQLLLRALVYRAVTDRLARAGEPLRPDHADPYRRAVDLACGLASARSDSPEST